MSLWRMICHCYTCWIMFKNKHTYIGLGVWHVSFFWPTGSSKCNARALRYLTEALWFSLYLRYLKPQSQTKAHKHWAKHFACFVWLSEATWKWSLDSCSYLDNITTCCNLNCICFSQEVVRNEIQVMNQLNHANLIQLYAAFESRHDFILVME